MFKLQNLVYLLVIATLLVSGCTTQTPSPPTPMPGKSGTTATATASKPLATITPAPTREINPARLAAMEKCANILPGQACLVEGPVQVTAQPDRFLRPFREPGQTLTLADLQSLKLGEAGSTKGLVVMRIATEWPGGALVVEAFGNVELVNEVPFGTREFNPMQSLSFSTGEAEDYDQALTRGLMVDAPHDGTLNTLVINGVEMVFGSTAFLTSMGGFLNVSTIFGAVGLNLRDLVQIVEEGKYYNVPREYSTRNVANTEPLRPLTDEEYDA